MSFKRGDRVLTPGGYGTVMYVRMAAPEFSTPEAYSVRLDKPNPGAYTGTVYPANCVCLKQ